MKYKYNNEWKDIKVKVGDTLPVGSIIEYDGDTVPYGWEECLPSSLTKRIYIGSQCIHPAYTGDGKIEKVPIVGAYEFYLYNALFVGLNVPEGYHKEIRITAMMTNETEKKVTLYLNNMELISASTWSGNSFRALFSSDFIKESSIVQEPILTYGGYGCQIKVSADEGAGNWGVYNITVHAYFAKDEEE